MSGSGLMVCCAVGENSYYGKLKMNLMSHSDDTPLQIKLSNLAEKIGNFGIYFAFFIFAALFFHYLLSFTEK